MKYFVEVDRELLRNSNKIIAFPPNKHVGHAPVIDANRAAINVYISPGG